MKTARLLPKSPTSHSNTKELNPDNYFTYREQIATEK